MGLLKKQYHIYFRVALKHNFVLQDLVKRFEEMDVQLDLNELNFILGLYTKSTSDILQLLMLIANYNINMCRCTNKKLNFMGYKVNVQSLYQSHK